MAELPSGWTEVPLAAVAEVRVSNVDKKSFAGELPVKLCNYLDVYREDYLDDSHAYMEATATHAEVMRFRLQPGDVVITKDSETPDDIGIPAVIDDAADNLVCGYHLAIIRPTTQLNATWLAKQLSHEGTRRYFARQATGTTRYGLSNASMNGLPLLLPPRAEQDRGARILRTVDYAIRETEQVIAKLQQMKQGLVHNLLTRGIDDNGELRDPERHPEKFTDTILGAIPSRWSVRTLGSLAEILDSQRRPVNSNERSKRPGNVPYYGANGQQGWIDQPLFNEPLILLAEDGGNFDEFATRPIAYRIDGPSWVNNHAHILRASVGVDQGFLFFALEHRDIRRYISGGTRTKLTQAELRSIEVATPVWGEQQRIAAVLDAYMRRIEDEQASLAKYRMLKAGLMDDLLTGRVRFSVRTEAAT